MKCKPEGNKGPAGTWSYHRSDFKYTSELRLSKVNPVLSPSVPSKVKALLYKAPEKCILYKYMSTDYHKYIPTFLMKWKRPNR